MDGLLLVNKPKNCTSHDIVYKVKKILNTKVGHTGTLDPMAEGVLPLLIGKGTLCSKYLINHDKKYIATIQLGKKTDTGDAEGSIIETKEIDKNLINYKNIKIILNRFIGEQEQIPPKYSAIKINGKKLYEYARKNIEVQIPSRKIKIYNIKLIEIDKKYNRITIEVFCGKGTYIRSLCEDIAESLNTVGYMYSLLRTQVGDFKIEDCINLYNIENNNSELEKNIITIEKLFKEKPRINLNEEETKLLINGVKITKELNDDVYKVYNNIFIGLGVILNGKLKRDIII